METAHLSWSDGVGLRL